MSITDDENWEFLNREHEEMLKDPEYASWIKWLNQQSPLTPEEQKQWDDIVQKGQAGHF